MKITKEGLKKAAIAAAVLLVPGGLVFAGGVWLYKTLTKKEEEKKPDENK